MYVRVTPRPDNQKPRGTVMIVSEIHNASKPFTFGTHDHEATCTAFAEVDVAQFLFCLLTKGSANNLAFL